MHLAVCFGSQCDSLLSVWTFDRSMAWDKGSVLGSFCDLVRLFSISDNLYHNPHMPAYPSQYQVQASIQETVTTYSQTLTESSKSPGNLQMYP